MKFNVLQYNTMLAESSIEVIYSGPLWARGIDGMAEMLLKRLEYADIPLNASQSVFSVFIEQMNNMLMYSAEKELSAIPDGSPENASRGIYILGVKGSAYFLQTGNAVTPQSAKILKERLDHLNSMDKQELRQYYKQQLKSGNDNPESRGAGVGLIEIARRAAGPIEYAFEPYGDGLQYFSMYVTINQGGNA